MYTRLPGQRRASATTDASGAFTLRGVLAGEKVRVSAYREAGAQASGIVEVTVPASAPPSRPAPSASAPAKRSPPSRRKAARRDDGARGPVPLQPSGRSAEWAFVRSRVAVLALALLPGLLLGVPAEARRKQPDPQRPVPTSCCRVCSKGCACGDACISCSKVCRKPPGCACNAR